jgi:acetyl esterase/lipase
MASSGLVVVSLDFRQGPDHQHPCAMSDIVAGVRWSKLHAAEFGGNPGNVVMVGNCSGGHLAILAAIRPHIDGSVRYVVANWPVSDPLYRYRYTVQMEREGTGGELAGVLRRRGADEGGERAADPGRRRGAGATAAAGGAAGRGPERAAGDDAVPDALLPAAGEPPAFTYEASDATEDCLALMTDFIHRQAR